MDLSTILGTVAAFSLMAMAILSGGPLGLFINPPSLIIVFGGTLGATLTHYPFRDVFKLPAIAAKTIFFKLPAADETIQQAITFSNKARKEGLLAIQDAINDLDDPFFIKGLQMAVDGVDKDSVDEALQKEIEYTADRHDYGAEIFDAIGAYAPAMGMIGTLIGLVQMLQTMDDPSTIGPAMAIALLTTFYGAVIANILALPMAGKLRARGRDEALRKQFIREAVLSIVEGENPKIMEQKLLALLPPKERLNHTGKGA